ncbi:MAG: trypsin [Anaerolineaceae bacterium]|nr:MAG: trypsin [Anaerolineaceae bacterium]
MKYLTALFALFILLVIILADMGRLGFLGFAYAFPMGDKAGHFLLFGILSFLINLTALRSRRFSDPKRVAVTLTLILALLVAAEEFSQKYFANRTFSISDLLFGYAGIFLGMWLAFKK